MAFVYICGICKEVPLLDFGCAKLPKTSTGLVTALNWNRHRVSFMERVMQTQVAFESIFFDKLISFFKVSAGVSGDQCSHLGPQLAHLMPDGGFGSGIQVDA